MPACIATEPRSTAGHALQPDRSVQHCLVGKGYLLTAAAVCVPQTSQRQPCSRTVRGKVMQCCAAGEALAGAQLQLALASFLAVHLMWPAVQLWDVILRTYNVLPVHLLLRTPGIARCVSVAGRCWRFRSMSGWRWPRMRQHGHVTLQSASKRFRLRAPAE